MDQSHNISSAPKTTTFQMRMNPEIKQRAEQLYASYGLNLTDAINIFIQQSLKTHGLPFLLSPENEEYMKAKARKRLVRSWRPAGTALNRTAGSVRMRPCAGWSWMYEPPIYAARHERGRDSPLDWGYIWKSKGGQAYSGQHPCPMCRPHADSAVRHGTPRPFWH